MNSFYQQFFHAQMMPGFRLGAEPNVQFTADGIPYIKDAIVMQLNVPGVGTGKMYPESHQARGALNNAIDVSQDVGIGMEWGHPKLPADMSGEQQLMMLKTINLNNLAARVFNARLVSEWEGKLLLPGCAVVGDIVPSMTEAGLKLQNKIREGCFDWRTGVRSVGSVQHWAQIPSFGISEITGIDLLFDQEDAPTDCSGYTLDFTLWRLRDRARDAAEVVYGSGHFPREPEPKRPNETPVSFKVQVADVPQKELERLGFEPSMTVADIEGVLAAGERHIELMTRKCDLPGAGQPGFDLADALAQWINDPSIVKEQQYLVVHYPKRRDSEARDEDTRSE